MIYSASSRIRVEMSSPNDAAMAAATQFFPSSCSNIFQCRICEKLDVLSAFINQLVNSVHGLFIKVCKLLFRFNKFVHRTDDSG